MTTPNEPHRLQSVGKVLVSNIFNNASSFVVIVHAARSFGPEVFGQLGLVLAIMLFASTILDFGLNVSLVRNYNRAESPRERTDLAASVIKTKVSMVIAVGAMAYPAARLMLPVFPTFTAGASLLAIGILSASLLSLWSSIRALEQARRQFDSFARYNYMYAAVRVTCYISTAFLGENSPIAVLLCLYTIPLLLLLSYSLVVRERTVWWPLRTGVPRQISALGRALRYGRWICASLVCFSLFVRLPQFELARKSSAQALGIYGAAASFLAAFSLINDAISSIILPEVSSLRTPGAREYFRHTFSENLLKLAGVLVLGLIICVLAQSVLLGEKYHDSVPTFIVLGLSTIISLCFSINNNLVHAYGRPELWLYMNLGRLVALGAALSAFRGLSAFTAAVLYGAELIAGDVLLFLYLRRYTRLDRVSISSTTPNEASTQVIYER